MKRSLSMRIYLVSVSGLLLFLAASLEIAFYFIQVNSSRISTGTLSV